MTISLPLAFYLLAVHYAADWCLQTRAQATEKSSDNAALTAHVLSYTAALFGALLLYRPAIALDPILAFVSLNSALHWVTDWFTSRLNARAWKRGAGNGSAKSFWVLLGMDGCLHNLTLLSTAAWLLT